MLEVDVRWRLGVCRRNACGRYSKESKGTGYASTWAGTNSGNKGMNDDTCSKRSGPTPVRTEPAPSRHRTWGPPFPSAVTSLSYSPLCAPRGPESAVCEQMLAFPSLVPPSSRRTKWGYEKRKQHLWEIVPGETQGTSGLGRRLRERTPSSASPVVGKITSWTMPQRGWPWTATKLGAWESCVLGFVFTPLNRVLKCKGKDWLIWTEAVCRGKSKQNKALY